MVLTPHTVTGGTNGNSFTVRSATAECLIRV